MTKQIARTPEQVNTFRNTLLTAIAKEFPLSKLTTNGTGNPTGFLHEDGESGVYLSYNECEHRVIVSGRWLQSSAISRDGYRSADYVPSRLGATLRVRPSITISADKTPEKIAEEIRRRFLPEYCHIIIRLRAMRDKDDDFRAKEKSLRDQVADALKTATHGPMGFELPAGLREGRCYGGVTVSGESVSFDLSNLEGDLALKLIAFLKTI